MQNPYGAVPDALQNTVKNLQWIAEQNAQGRRDENQSSLLLSNAEGKKAEIAAQILRDATQGDLSRTQLEITKNTSDANIRASDAAANQHNIQSRILQRAEARKAEVKTIGQFMEEMGAGHLKDLRSDVNKKLSRSDFEIMAEPLKKMLSTNPYGAYIEQSKKEAADITTAAQEIAALSPTDPVRRYKENSLKARIDKHKAMNDILLSGTQPTDDAIQALYWKTKSELPYSEFAQNVIDGHRKIHASRIDLEKEVAFVTKHGMTPAAVNDEIARAQQNLIQSGNPDAIKANTWFKQELKKEKPDLGEVLRIAKGWNEHFSRPKTNLAQPSAAPSLKQTVNRPDAQNQETGVSIIDKIWYYTGKKTLKDLAISKQEREKRSKSLGNQIKDFITP